MADPLPADDELRIHLLDGFRVIFRGRAVFICAALRDMKR
jgi:hypothetical protein